ncbi:MAG: glycosyltransferase family 4 protein [Thermodesulfobacteriota bacterium]|nr:glycosyltransferase family 4 protein [Thermodesulfobacteriota bacterium]
MRIIFLTHSSDQGHRFRVEQYFPYLRTHQVEPKWQPLASSMKERFSIYRQLPFFDVVCIQRRLLSPIEFHWVRRKSRKIVFDLDDAIMYRSSSSPEPHSFSRWFKFRWMVRGSDIVIAGNHFLRDEVLKVDQKKKVFLIPTSIDMSLYPKKKEVSEGTEIVLGWIGTKGNIKYLKKLEPVFESLSQRFPHIKLKVVSNDLYESHHLPIINKSWKLEEENEDLISFDIGLMPLDDDLWSKGKCGLKIVQYLSVGVPAVCTPVGINSDIVVDGQNGFWAMTNEEWVDRLSLLIQDHTLREKMGLHGIQTVEKCYSLAVTSEKFLKVLQSLFSSHIPSPLRGEGGVRG